MPEGHISIYERVYFDADGEPVKWERSFDRQHWEAVDWGGKPPFVLIKQIALPGFVETETWEPR